MCSFSQATGIVALLLGRLDLSAARGWNFSELFVLEVDTRNAAAAAPTKVELDILGPAPPGTTWRLENPYLSHSE